MISAHVEARCSGPANLLLCPGSVDQIVVFLVRICRHGETALHWPRLPPDHRIDRDQLRYLLPRTPDRRTETVELKQLRLRRLRIKERHVDGSGDRNDIQRMPVLVPGRMIHIIPVVRVPAAGVKLPQRHVVLSSPGVSSYTIDPAVETSGRFDFSIFSSRSMLAKIPTSPRSPQPESSRMRTRAMAAAANAGRGCRLVAPVRATGMLFDMSEGPIMCILIGSLVRSEVVDSRERCLEKVSVPGVVGKITRVPLRYPPVGEIQAEGPVGVHVPYD